MSMTDGRTDRQTVDYFNKQVTEYSLGRFDYVLHFLNQHANRDHSFLDIGCGVGNILELVRRETPIERVAGIDAAEKCVEKTRERLKCHAFVGSILDTDFIDSLEQRFDFALIASVLHHLVGNSREESIRNAEIAVGNCLKLMSPGGHLFVFEPGVYPAWTAAALFHTKRFFTRFTSRRIQLFDKWNNIGAPVISYYTDVQLTDMARRQPGCDVVGQHVGDMHVNFLWRVCGITRRINTTLVVRRSP